MKKLAIIGAHGVGKKDLCNLLCQMCTQKNITTKIVPDPVGSCPFPLHDKQTISGTLWLCCKQIHLELEREQDNPDLVVCTRSVIDPLVYLLANKPEDVNSDLVTFAESYLKTYDVIYLLKPSSKVSTEDKIEDKEYQYIIHSIFSNWIVDKCTIIDSEILKTEKVNDLCKNILSRLFITKGM